ncbi:MAG: GNAT family N-acetyltransferase [Candidatus Hodarchaeales archaeon]
MNQDKKIIVKIRKPKLEDEIRKCAHLMANSEPWITLRRDYNESFENLNDSSKELYVVVLNDEIIGFILLQMQGSIKGYIQSMGIVSEWRNKGIGSQLIKFAEDKIFKDTPNVFICVSSFNVKAQELYTKLGYEIIGELKDYIVSGHSEILLRKTVGSLTGY